MFKISMCILDSDLVTPCTSFKYTYSKQRRDIVWIVFQIQVYLGLSVL